MFGDARKLLLANAIPEPSGENTGVRESASPSCPEESVETRVIEPSMRFLTKMSTP